MEADPNNSHDAVIVDLENAPRNAKGLVEFSTQFMILKPVDMQRSNHKIFYGINNRGNKLEIARFNFASLVNNPMTAADAGDGFLMRLGYTYLDAGWEGDVAPGNDRLVPNLPVATQPGGSPIIARVRITSGNFALGPGVTDQNGDLRDVVVMDDFLYGEPRVPDTGWTCLFFALALTLDRMMRARRPNRRQPHRWA